MFRSLNQWELCSHNTGPAMIDSLLHYDIKEKLGQGGMGIVYRAHDTKLDREVALKFLPSHISLDSNERERFMQEARAAAALNHPNIAQVFAIEEADDEVFIVMEYIDGKELNKIAGDADFKNQELESIALQIAKGLKAAHDKGVVHRDIKSGNIMLDSNGKPKIMDFGLARIEGAAHITKSGTTIGTTSYMSPEQLSSHDVDKRSDIWAYGVVLYELFTGELPFTGAYEPAIIYSITEEDPAPPSKLNEAIPTHIEGIILQCLKKEPEERYQDFGEVLDDLEAKKQPSASPPKSLPEKMTSSKGLTKVLYAAIPAVLILLLLFFTPLSSYLGMNNLFGSNLPEKQGLAILPFNNISQNQSAEMELISDGLLQTLTSKLTQVDNYRGALWVLPASEIVGGNVTSPSQARKEHSVNLALTGSLQELGDNINFSMNLINTKTLQQLSSREIVTDKDSLSVLHTRAASVLLEMLNIELEPEINRALTLEDSKEPKASEYYYRGRGYLLRYEKGDNLDKAINAFQQAIDSDSTYALAHAALGESYLRKFQLTQNTEFMAQAEAAANNAMKIDSNLVSVVKTLGLIHRETGEYERAIQNFKKVLTLEPSNDMAFRQLASTYATKGELERAEQNYKIAIELKPDYWKNYDQLGYFYLRYRGNPKKALENFKKVVELAPDNYIGLSHLGIAYFSMGDYQRAVDYLEQSLNIRKTFGAASNLGTVYYSMQNYQQAIRNYTIAHEINPNNQAVVGNLASAHEAVGNTDLARDYYQKAIDLAHKQLEVNPNDATLNNDLGVYYADIGNQEMAEKYLQRSIDLDSNNNQILFRTAAAYERMGQRNEALKWIEEAIKKGYPISTIKGEPELKKLTESQEFEQIVKKYSNKQQQ